MEQVLAEMAAFCSKGRSNKFFLRKKKLIEQLVVLWPSIA